MREEEAGLQKHDLETIADQKRPVQWADVLVSFWGLSRVVVTPIFLAKSGPKYKKEDKSIIPSISHEQSKNNSFLLFHVKLHLTRQKNRTLLYKKRISISPYYAPHLLSQLMIAIYISCSYSHHQKQMLYAYGGVKMYRK